MRSFFAIAVKFFSCRSTLKILFLIIAALAIFGTVFFLFHFKGKTEQAVTLEIHDTSSGKVYGSWPLGEAGEFAVEFIHSVNQSPVRETFKIDGRMIRPYSVRFSSFGAGMQSDLTEGQTLSRDGDSLVLSGFNTSYLELNYIVGADSDHLFFINDEIVCLRELCGKNVHITIRLR